MLKNKAGAWKLVRKMRVKYFWVFLTERCNLRCGYCFFRGRDGRSNLKIASLDALYDNLTYLEDAEPVISGGEPFLEWDLARRAVDSLKRRHRRGILLQTNGILLDRKKINWLKARGCALEIGYDGKLAGALRKRSGLDSYLGRLKDNLALIKESGVGLTITMAVCPDEVNRIPENFQEVLGVGPDKIEVTPTAFEPWTSQAFGRFIEAYKEVIRYLLLNKLLDKLSMDYDRPLPYPCLDIIPLPDGSVVTNWALLALPKSRRDLYSLGRLESGRWDFNPVFPERVFQTCLKAYEERPGKITYRDYSNLYAKMVYQELFGAKPWRSYFECYESIGKAMGSMHERLSGVQGVKRYVPNSQVFPKRSRGGSRALGKK